MQLILNIPAQKATQNVERLAFLSNCYKDGSLLLETCDGLKPAQIYLSSNDIFPWDAFISKLILSWNLCDYSDIPKPFIPLKRIPSFIIEEIEKESTQNQLKILALLRKEGFFSPLSNRKTF